MAARPRYLIEEPAGTGDTCPTRRGAMEPHLHRLIGQFHRVSNTDKTAADGSYVVRVFGDESSLWPAAMYEYKNSISSSQTEPHLQLALILCKKWGSNESADVIKCSACPTILLVIPGYQVDVQAMIVVGRPVVQKLINPLALDRALTEEYVQEVCWIFKCIRAGIEGLTSYYRRLRKVDQPSDEAFFPVYTELPISKGL
ncbi:hypothetical protein DACRYDRAFT_21593, partial [Dacryopinax primogenitus]